MLSLDTIRHAPKAVLHDHLDGGLRPTTIIDLAAQTGYRGLPTTDPEALAAWIRRGADRKSLELYLETFAHTVAVMQDRDAIIRVAAECAEDLAADGVVYAEVRMAPELCTERGLTLDEVQAAILEGYRIGEVRAAEAGRPIVMRAIVTAMRQAARSVEVAECAVRFRDQGVVGFDVAGPEKGFPPTRYLDAFEHIRRENFHITIHAGEAFGLPAPEITATIVARHFRPLLLGRDPLETTVLWELAYGAQRGGGQTAGFMLEALSGIDTALWDIKGKALGLPVAQLLGGAFRDRVPVYASPVPFLPTPEESARGATAFVGQGFRGVKLKVGRGVAVGLAEQAVRQQAPLARVVAERVRDGRHGRRGAERAAPAARG